MFKKLNKLFYICAAFAIFAASAAAGIKFVVIKNEQTLVQREIDEAQQRTTKNTNLLNQYKAELQNTNNRFLLKERVKQMDTELTPIQAKNVIAIQSAITPSLAQSE